MSGKDLIPVKKTEIAQAAGPEVFGLWRAKHKFRFGAGVAHAAAYEGRADIIHHMLSDQDLETCVYRAFYRAAANNDVKILQAMIEGGIDVNRQLKRKSAIMQAASHAGTKSVELLLENGADPDTRGSNDWTPLMWSAYINDYGTAKLLLKAGANPCLLNDEKKDAAMIADEDGHTETWSLISLAKQSKAFEQDQ